MFVHDNTPPKNSTFTLHQTKSTNVTKNSNFIVKAAEVIDINTTTRSTNCPNRLKCFFVTWNRATHKQQTVSPQDSYYVAD